jgi:hypothetical protein
VHVDGRKILKVKSDFFKKKFFAESQRKTLGEEILHREPAGLLSAKNSSLRVFSWLSAKNLFAESFSLALGEEIFGTLSKYLIQTGG